MSKPAVLFDAVWKKFQRGERHDSLRDLIPATVGRLFRPRPTGELQGKEFWAIRDVSFEVRPGEALGIIGPNGAGKSTALKLLTRILRPTKGRAEVRGRVGALIEVAAGFHPDLTGRENIYLQGAIMGMKRAEIVNTLDAIIDFAGVSDFIDTPVKRYSSGMNARLGFAIAAHLNPEVLIIDEVLSVGDMVFQEKCVNRLKEQLAAGVTTVFVSHHLPAVAALCRRVVVLAGGRMMYDGGTADGFEKYLEASRGNSGRWGRLDPLLTVGEVSFTTASGRTFGEPHERCELVLRLTANRAYEGFNLGFEFERTHDLICVYAVTTDELGLPPLVVAAGDEIEVHLSFMAHLVKGHFRVHVNARDSIRGVHLFAGENFASFTIHEEVSTAGVAALEPRVSVTRSHPKEAEPAASRARLG